MVTLYVGPKQKKWTLHKELLCHRSSFFRDSIVGQSPEADRTELNLPDTDEEAFEVFVTSLYGGGVKAIDSEGDKWWTHFRLYMLGSKFCMESLMNATMDRIQPAFGPPRQFGTARALLNEDLVDYIFQNTEASSPFRSWAAAAVAEMMRISASSFSFHKLFENAIRQHVEFAVLLIAELENQYHPHPFAIDPESPCAFHVHKQSEKCKSSHAKSTPPIYGNTKHSALQPTLFGSTAKSLPTNAPSHSSHGYEGFGILPFVNKP
ncbi:MAG: hypothetical protein M1836_005789 [Candelina mexicana]|nr:MAG: hypothetical protein M1836_005789 [Candelina mexicana]